MKKNGTLIFAILSCLLMAAAMLTSPNAVAADVGDRGVPDAVLTSDGLEEAVVRPSTSTIDLIEAPASAKSVEIRSVVEPGLAVKAAEMAPSELVRIIVFLAYQPQDVIGQQVESRYSGDMAKINTESRALRAKYAALRDPDAETDSENYRSDLLRMTDQDRSALREMNEDHEALSTVIRNEMATLLRSEVEKSQQSVIEAIESLGGSVEFGIIASNAVVAVVPAGAIEKIADLEIVGSISEDRRMQQALNIADNATKVSWTNGLWDNGQTGGLYDPAVLDTGTDLSHPFLADDAVLPRTNFYSWYLVGGYDDPLFDDVTNEDDLTGHGTHVAGIVASYGSATYPEDLGMAFGVEKLVTLKAGWLGTDNEGHMYRSDAMKMVDRALYDTDLLRPFGTFADDVDGINLSFGSEADADEDDYCRFYDSIVSSYSNLVVTICAGNVDDGNIYVWEPAVSFNPIAVANVDDENTVSRDDDTINPGSCIGPTIGNRRKPDIAAPGTEIFSANNNWELTGQSEHVSKSGTSMAAPMVLGVAMDLMDAGVLDELEIKALLLNTAQKNEDLIDFESDADGWHEAYGWGYMNAWAAYYHRNDVISASVTERPNPGYFRLYAGQMRDEGAIGEGRDRATLVWNRHVTYNPAAYPTTYYGLSDLNIRLYRETDNDLIDTDFALDNVHQVRVDAGTPTTDVVVKVYSWSLDFPHGGTTETFALATEENFVEVAFPTSFQGISFCPGEVEPSEEFDCEFWMRNNSEIASHNNQFDLMLPTGWTLLSGADPFSAGSIPGEGDSSIHAVWRLKAQPTEQDNVRILKQHNHESYAETYTGPIFFNEIDVRVDSTPPSPNPMLWATVPYETSSSNISMVAATASDVHEPVEYFFDFTSSPTGGTGGTDSGYITSTAYSDSGLQANHQYCYRVRARDSAATPNYTSYSTTSCDYTSANPPGTAKFSKVNASSIQVNWAANGNPVGTQYYVENTTKGTTYGWTTSLYWRERRLDCETTYSYRVKARNGDGAETAWTYLGSQRTKKCRPNDAVNSSM